MYKTILLLRRINTNAALHSRIEALLLNFPEQQDLAVTEVTFEKLTFDRKTESYRKALDIARLLLLNYHPDVSKGRNHVLALMFDMNLLWERFVYVSLRKGLLREKADFTIHDQVPKYFWKPKTAVAARSNLTSSSTRTNRAVRYWTPNGRTWIATTPP